MMQLENLTSLIVTLVIILLASWVVLIRYLQNLSIDLEKTAYKLNFEVLRRADLLPLLMESLDKNSLDESYSAVILARQEARKLGIGEAGKSRSEQLLWEQVRIMLDQVEKTEQKNLQLSAFKKSLVEVEEMIERIKNNFNKKLASWQKWQKFPLVKIAFKKKNNYLVEQF